MHVRKNALQILIPKYGLECTLYLAANKEETTMFHYDEENQTQSCGGVVFHAFDPVVVRLRLDSNNIQHEKFVLELVEPCVEGFSVPAMGQLEKKRKSKELRDGGKKKKA